MAVMHYAFSQYSGTKIRKLVTYFTFIYLIIATVSAQGCTNIVGSQEYNMNELPVPVDTTSILTGYTIPCNGTVIAWEFCYQISSASSVSVFPGIWRITEANDYVLVQSNNITYDSRGTSHNTFRCRTFNLSSTDQFIAQAGTVIGLYTGNGQVLRTSENNLITTYQLLLNRTVVSNTDSDDVNYSIAIRVKLTSTDNSAASVVPTSDTTTVPPTTSSSIVSISEATTVTPTTSIVSTSDATIVTPTTSILSTSNATTVTLTSSIVSTSDATTVISTTTSGTARIVIRTTTLNNGNGDTATSVTPSTMISDGSDNSGNSLDGTAIIVIGAMGGIIILLLIIPIVVCGVVLCVRKRDRKLKHPKVKDRMHHEIPPPPPTNINLICNNHVTQCNIQQSYSGNANPSHGVSTEEATVTTAFSATSDKNIYQPSDNDTTGKYDYLHPHHNMPTNSTDDAMKDYMASVDQGNHLAQPSDKNGGYAVIRQRKCDYLDDEPTDGVDNPSDGSSHNAPTISLISSANLSIDGNGHKKYDSIKYGVVTLLRSDNQSL